MKASEVGVLMYFGAGLLPDPDTPFKPSKSNYHTWLIAMTFELLMLVATHLTASASHGLTHLEASELALGCARFIMLLIMSMVLVPAHCGRLRKGQGERQTLLDEGEPVSKYDSFPGILEKVGDAQSTGWLDYFIGFSALFPYIWYSSFFR